MRVSKLLCSCDISKEQQFAGCEVLDFQGHGAGDFGWHHSWLQGVYLPVSMPCGVWHTVGSSRAFVWPLVGCQERAL